MPINSISIQGVRGIRTQIRIDLRGRSLLVHGDNGTGKSSIECGMRWALLGDPEPTGEAPFTSEDSFRQHVLCDGNEPSVEVSLVNDGVLNVKIQQIETDPLGNELRAQCQKGNPFLKRAEILSFLNSKPGDRFSYLDSFLDLAVADQTIKAYQEKSAHCRDTRLEKERKIVGHLLPLSAKLPAEFKPKGNSWPDFEQALVAQITSLGLYSEQDNPSWQLIVGAGDAAREMSEGDTLETHRANLIAARDAITRFNDSGGLDRLEDLLAIASEAEALKRSSTDASISKLLTHARNILRLI